jgi:hypothetical protein
MTNGKGTSNEGCTMQFLLMQYAEFMSIYVPRNELDKR